MNFGGRRGGPADIRDSLPRTSFSGTASSNESRRHSNPYSRGYNNFKSAGRQGYHDFDNPRSEKMDRNASNLVKIANCPPSINVATVREYISCRNLHWKDITMNSSPG